MASPSKLAADLLATTVPMNDRVNLEALLKAHIQHCRGEGKGKLADQLTRLVDALQQVSASGTPSAASKAVLAAYGETLKSYSADRREIAEVFRDAALIPPPPEEVKKRWQEKEAGGQNKGTDVKRQMKRAESELISDSLRIAAHLDNSAKFMESLRPRFAELSQSLGLDGQQNRGAAR